MIHAMVFAGVFCVQLGNARGFGRLVATTVGYGILGSVAVMVLS